MHTMNMMNSISLLNESWDNDLESFKLFNNDLKGKKRYYHIWHEFGREKV